MKHMPIVTYIIAALLIGVGIVSFVTTGKEHYTSLIPCALGALLIVCAVIAGRGGKMLKHGMHAAAMLALIGFVGTVRGLSRLPALLEGQAVLLPEAVPGKSATAILCAIFLGICIASFIQARKARAAL